MGQSGERGPHEGRIPGHTGKEKSQEGEEPGGRRRKKIQWQEDPQGSHGSRGRPPPFGCRELKREVCPAIG